MANLCDLVVLWNECVTHKHIHCIGICMCAHTNIVYLYADRHGIANNIAVFLIMVIQHMQTLSKWASKHKYKCTTTSLLKSQPSEIEETTESGFGF